MGRHSISTKPRACMNFSATVFGVLPGAVLSSRTAVASFGKRNLQEFALRESGYVTYKECDNLNNERNDELPPLEGDKTSGGSSRSLHFSLARFQFVFGFCKESATPSACLFPSSALRMQSSGGNGCGSTLSVLHPQKRAV